jgi:hypothetical protein
LIVDEGRVLDPMSCQNEKKKNTESDRQIEINNKSGYPQQRKLDVAQQQHVCHQFWQIFPFFFFFGDMCVCL